MSSSAPPPATVSSGEGHKISINPELWQACAGPLVSLPVAGTHVVYFPQGHTQQVAASMKKDAGAEIPNYPNLGPELLCQLNSVSLHADMETDEVYAQMTLQPVASFDKDDLLRSDLSLKVSKPPPEFFCKTLTASDTSTHGGFSVPRRAAEKIFPQLDFSMQPPAQELTAKDLHDKLWTFRHIYRGQPKRHLLTTGWSLFVSGKRLFAGDSVIFVRDQNQNLLVGLRRANRQPTNLPSSVLSSDSMHIGILAAAAHAAVENSPFTIFYNPRASPLEFIIPLAKYYRAVSGQQISVGMRFRMQFETEDSGTRRYMGTIAGISDLDPVRWKNSQWRNLQVVWDDTSVGERCTRVSAWEIEPVTAPFFICPPYFRAKHPRDSGFDASEFENVFKRSIPWLGDDIYMKDTEALNGLNLAQRMNMLQNSSLANSVQPNILDSSPAFSLQSLLSANNFQFNMPRQIQQTQQLDQLQRFQQQQLQPEIPQARQSLINQNLLPGQVHSQIQNASSLQQQQLFNQSHGSGQAHSQILLSQNIIPNTASLQYSQQQHTIFKDSWQNNLAGPQLPNQCGQFSQHLEQLQQLPSQLPFQLTHLQSAQNPNVHQSLSTSVVEMQQSHPQISGHGDKNNLSFHKLPQIQQQPSSLISELQGHQPSVVPGCNFDISAVMAQSVVMDNIPNAVQTIASTGPQSNYDGLETMASNGKSWKDFHLKPDGEPYIIDLSNPDNRELFGEHTYQSLPVTQLDYLDTSSATSASITQSDIHLNQNNSQSLLSRHTSHGVEAQATTMDLSNISAGGLMTSYGNCKEAQQDLSSSMITQCFSVQDLTFNSFDSAVSENQVLNRNTWAPPPSQHQRIRTFTKVYKRGAVGRCIDLTRYSGYEELKQDLARRFSIEGQLEDKGRIGWKLVYVDHENDMLLVGDDPWEEFVRCVRSIKILSPQEVQQMSLDGDCANLSQLPNQA